MQRKSKSFEENTMKYDYSEPKAKFHVWQQSGISPGKKIDVRTELSKLKFEEKLKSYDSGEKISFVPEKRKSCASLSDDHPCTEEACVLTLVKLRSRVA